MRGCFFKWDCKIEMRLALVGTGPGISAMKVEEEHLRDPVFQKFTVHLTVKGRVSSEFSGVLEVSLLFKKVVYL